MHVEIRVFLHADSPVLEIIPAEPIPMDHTLAAVMAVLRAAFADYARYTGSDIGDITNIRVRIEPRKTPKTRCAKATTPAAEEPPASGPRR